MKTRTRSAIVNAVRSASVESLFADVVVDVANTRLRQSETAREVGVFTPGAVPVTTSRVSDVQFDSLIAPPADSWWTRREQAGFTAYAAQEYQRMRHSKFATPTATMMTDLG